MSYKVEVIADDSGQWASNALRFETFEEADAYADDIYRRWSLVRETRVAASEDPPKHRFVNGKAINIA